MTPITEEWLEKVGFKWHQLDRQPSKQWLLWIGGAMLNSGMFASIEDLGIELAPCWFKNRNGDDAGSIGHWFCWLRDDSSHRYHRFIHLRHLQTTEDLIKLIEGLTGQPWDPANNMMGVMQRPEQAAQIRAGWERLDRRMRRERPKWSSVEKDDSMGGALPEHLEAHEKAKDDDSKMIN